MDLKKVSATKWLKKSRNSSFEAAKTERKRPGFFLVFFEKKLDKPYKLLYNHLLRFLAQGLRKVEADNGDDMQMSVSFIFQLDPLERGRKMRETKDSIFKYFYNPNKFEIVGRRPFGVGRNGFLMARGGTKNETHSQMCNKMCSRMAVNAVYYN